MLEANPYLHLRHRAGITQRRFCDQYDFAKQTVILIEHGTYTELSDRMIRAIEEACFRVGFDPHHELEHEYGFRDVQQAYNAWKTAQRSKITLRHVPTEGTEDSSPVMNLVKGATGTVQGFSKAIKVPPTTLLRYARGEQELMPAPIREALIECGYAYIAELEELQLKWKVKYASV